MTAAESPAEILRRAADRLDELDRAASRPWLVWDNIHGDPVLTRDQDRGRVVAVATFSTATPDYGRANVALAAALRPVAGPLAASLRATADRWDEDNILDRPESGEMQPANPEAWFCCTCQGAIESPDYPDEDQRCNCGWWVDMLTLARAALGETDGGEGR